MIIEGETATLYMKPDPQSPVNALAEVGVVARLGTCSLDWCRVSASGSKGWIEKRMLWGVDPEEIRE